MNVARAVILDLLPLYLAGEVSAETRALVDEYLKHDADLAQRVRVSMTEQVELVARTSLPPDLELKSLRRARRLIAWQRWLFAFGIFFTAISLTSQLSTQGWHITEFHFLIRDYPLQFGAFAALALVCWTGYYRIRRGLRMG
jgi:predicted anti-sigma-YlaC factor YlaD